MVLRKCCSVDVVFSVSVLPDEDKISPGEMAVLDCLMNGATALSLKANFVGQLPDIELLANTLTYLNLSFNEFAVSTQCVSE